MLAEFTEDILTGTEKQEVISAARSHIEGVGLSIVEENVDKPWGAYFRFADEDLERFLQSYYEREAYTPQEGVSWSPKLLLVAPGARLSFQYHDRRAEVWKVLEGNVGAVLSDSDTSTDPEYYEPGQVIEIAQGTRHRIVGPVDSWGIVAEIWQHVDADDPSNEEDNYRLEDDFGREGSSENI